MFVGSSSNLDPPLPFSYPPELLTIETSQEQCSAAKDYWLNRGQYLHGSKRDEFILHVNQVTAHILSTLSLMTSLGYSAEKINKEALRAIASLHFSGENYFKNQSDYQQQQCKTLQQLNNFEKRVQDSKMDFKPFSEFPSFVASEISGWLFDKSTAILENKAGKKWALGYQLLHESVRADVTAESKNPIRDRIASATVEIGVNEVKYTATIKQVKKWTYQFEQTLPEIKISHETEYWWNRQIQLTGEGPTFVCANPKHLLQARFKFQGCP